MATRTSHPGRTLIIFLLVIVGMFAWCAAIGEWKPKLGLDLQGGQRITLKATTTTGGGITKDKLDEAAGIISQRVNGVGVAESEVSTQGQNIIVVEVPGKAKEGLADTIGSTAQLRFRLESMMLPPSGTATTPAEPTPTEPTATGETSGTPQSGNPSTTAPSGDATAKPGDSTDKNRAGAAWLNGKPKAAQTTTTAPADEDPSGTAASGDPTGTEETGGVPPALVPPQLEPEIKDPLAWVQSPPQVWQQRLSTFDCDKRNTQLPGQADLPDQPLLACDKAGNRYLLGPMMVDGTDVSDASYGVPQTSLTGDYAVNVEFNGQGSKDFADVTRSIAGMTNPLTGDDQRLAIVLDGEMLSNPSNQEAITGGRAEITGNFSESEARDLANSLKYGALPLSFTVEAESNEGPELAANQLDAGIIAGIIGLLLVMLYCVFYYRGLSIVIITSLIVAGLMTYASVLLLGHGYGFTLTLPGIAGLIVAIGITADSFIVYFERLRDEVRDGRTLRTSVETGWARARNTILAADSISFLAALILFIFAIGVVKGFAFALGLSTVIDVFIVFFFTKPMVTLLSRTKFFGNGHKYSGLDREHLGLPPLSEVKAKPKPQPVGGEA